MLKRMIIMLLAAGIVFGGIFGLRLFYAHKMQVAMQSSFVPVQTVSALRVGYEVWQPKLQFVGSFSSVNGVDVTTEVPGLVTKILCASGDEVKKGDILVELNADTEKAHLSVLEAAAELAQITYDRDKAQYAINGISKATLDADAADLKSKKAQVLEQATLVEKKIIRAPFSGRLGIMIINEGQYLDHGDKIIPLQWLDTIFIKFFVPQQNIKEIVLNQPITLKTDSYPNQLFEGKITSIDPVADEDTRNVLVEGTLVNPEHKLLPGMYASVEVQIGEPQKYLTLPQTAISYNPYGNLVYVLQEEEKDNQKRLIAKQVFVTLGEARGDQVAILSGLNENDLVVIAGQLKLKNGAPVTINNEIVPPNEAHPVLSNEKS